MKPRSLAAALATSLVVAAPQALATGFACNVGSANLFVQEDGRVAASLLGSTQTGFVYLCNLASSTSAPGAATANIPIETCKGWYNTLVAARALNKPVFAQFNTDNTRAGSTGVTSCDSMVATQAWTYPNPMPFILQVNY